MNHQITGKSLMLLNSLIDYYRNNMNVMACIITQKNSLSLRVLDWLVTNYSKKYNIVYTLNKGNKKCNFNIYLDYKNQLKAYSKKLFDPFCRRERILLNTTTLNWEITDKKKCGNNEMITTVGQLNFFKWFIENNIINYAIENIRDIDNDMINTLEQTKKSNKRSELSKCASKHICSYEKKISINF